MTRREAIKMQAKEAVAAHSRRLLRFRIAKQVARETESGKPISKASMQLLIDVRAAHI